MLGKFKKTYTIRKNEPKIKLLFSLIVLAPLLLGCPQAGTLKTNPKKEVRDELIVEIQGQIKELGATPLLRMKQSIREA